MIFNQGYLEVGHGHKIYFEEFGQIDGIPIIFLHGGPGAGFSVYHRKIFQNKKFRVIFFDQRGSGKSIPFSSIKNNTTLDLINDIERLRIYLKIEKWFIFGGSWGSTLGILYGIKHPSSCLGFVLRGIFLGTKDEINWFLYDIQKFFPEAYHKFTSHIPEKNKNDILKWYHQIFTKSKKEESLKYAAIWNEYESSCSSLKYQERTSFGNQSIAIAKIEAHYFLNECFIEKNFILNNVKKISEIPCHIIQGRHDVICPPFNAYILSNKWKNSKLKIVEDGAHSGFEDPMFIEIQKSVNDIFVDID